MIPKHRLRLPILGLALAIAGCGHNALTVKSASQVNLTAQAVVTQAKAALDDAGARRERAYVTLIASDPSCPLTDPVYVFVPLGPPVAGAVQAPLCADGANDRRPGYRAEPISFVPLGNEALKPTLTLIGAVADYGDVLGKIAGAPKPDVAKDLEAILSKVTEARAVAEGLTGLSLPELPDLGSKQAKTATAPAQFIAELADEVQRVKDIRKAVRDHEDALPGIIADLREQVGIWQNIVAKGYAQITANNVARAYGEAERKRMSFEARTAMVTLFRQTERDAAAVPIAAAAFKAALGKFEEANSGLRRLLAGELTPEQRREAERITFERILGGLKLIAEAVTAWGGII